MRSAIINQASPKNDVLGVLTGVWDEYDDKSGWHVVKTPFMTVIEGDFAEGSHKLPFTFNGNVIVHTVLGSTGYGINYLVKQKQQAINFASACHAQAIIIGKNQIAEAV